MKPIPSFQCHKIVQAFLIGKVEGCTLHSATDPEISLTVKPAWMEAHNIASGAPGYLVLYTDGFVSWSPKDVFEAGYTLIGTDHPDTAATVEALAGKLYDVYRVTTGGKAFNGDPLPASEEFLADPTKQKQADAWREVARESLGLNVVAQPVTPAGVTDDDFDEPLGKAACNLGESCESCQ